MLTKSDWLLDPHDCPGFEKSEIVAHLNFHHSVHHTEELFLLIPKRYALVNLTEIISSILKRSKVQDGLCFVSTLHITSGIYINDAESGLLEDISEWIEKLAPFGENYQHHQTGEDNADAHLKSYLTHPSVILPITQKKLHFGPWQQVFYAEFDGNRRKKIVVKVVGLGDQSPSKPLE